MSLEKRIYNVFPDDARYRQARYRESANHPDWSPIDDALGSLKPARGQWRVFDLPTTGRDLPAADFFYFCLGTLAIRREAEQRLHFRERFRGSAEFLPFTVEGEPCFVIHFTAEHVALDYARSPHHRISNGRIIANSCGPEIFRADINIKGRNGNERGVDIRERMGRGQEWKN